MRTDSGAYRIDTPNLSVNEAAEYLRISRSSVYRLISEGTLRPYKVGGRTILDRRDLDAARQRHQVTAA